jgi:hypothetical protein
MIAFGKILHRIKQEVNMQITRSNHLRYMAKLTPVLIVLYVLQILIYRHYAPPAVANDVNLALGIGLAIIIFCYQFYDHHHQINFHKNYLELRFDVLKIKNEILYQNITGIELKKTRFNYGKIELHLKSGESCYLHHIDSPELVIEFLQQKKLRLA